MMSKQQRGGNEPRGTLQGEAGAGAKRVLGSAARQSDGDHAQRGADREPVDSRPEHGRDEMAVAVHVGVGVGGDLADEVQRVLPAERRKDLKQDEDADQDAVADKLVRHDGLDEEGKENEDEDLREGHNIELLEVLQEFVVVIAGDGLHHDADEHGESEENEFDDDDGGEAGEPVSGLAHGESVVNAVEMRVALAPEQLCGIEARDNEEKEEGTSLDRLDHEVGDRPHVPFGDAPGEITVIDAEGDDEGDEGPEGYVAENVPHPKAGEREVLSKRGGAVKGLMGVRKLSGHEGADGLGFREFLFFRFGGAAALRARGESLHRHGKQCPDRAQRREADTDPEQPVVEEYAIDEERATKVRTECSSR